MFNVQTRFFSTKIIFLISNIKFSLNFNILKRFTHQNSLLESNDKHVSYQWYKANEIKKHENLILQKTDCVAISMHDFVIMLDQIPKTVP